MKKGDIVICINNERCETILKLNNKYTIKDIIESWEISPYDFYNEDEISLKEITTGLFTSFKISRFITIKQDRKIKLENIKNLNCETIIN